MYLKFKLFKHRIIIEPLGLTNNQRARRFYKKKREKGLCARCNRQPGWNKNTGKPYLLCSVHREVANKQALARYYKNKTN
jgi:hypothetical protein